MVVKGIKPTIMKKQLMFSLAVLLLSSTVFGQVESDDMYFNSKDRAKLKAQTASEASSYVVASAKKSKKVEQAADEVVNPTDSYSARNVNPEFAARSNSQTAAADNQDYFVNNYRNATSSHLNNWNNNFSGWYNNNWYGSMSYNAGGPYGYGSPYYGSYYDTWGTPWYNTPYYGWTTGIGLSYGFGNPYYMNSWYGYPYAAYGFGYGGYGYGNYAYGYGRYGYGGGYPGTVVIINNGSDNGRQVAYGKRASRGGMVTTPQEASYTRSRTNYPTAVRPDDAGGRVSTSGRTTQRQEEYYNRSWRGSQQSNSYQQSQNNRSSSFDPWSGNSNRDSYNRDSNSSYSSPSRSSSSYDGGGTRQSAPASSGSNGRSRGRD